MLWSLWPCSHTHINRVNLKHARSLSSLNHSECGVPIEQTGVVTDKNHLTQFMTHKEINGTPLVREKVSRTISGSVVKDRILWPHIRNNSGKPMIEPL